MYIFAFFDDAIFAATSMTQTGLYDKLYCFKSYLGKWVVTENPLNWEQKPSSMVYKWV